MSMIRTFTETYDMNTEKDTPCLLGIHTPIGQSVRVFLDPCFRLYKKYKYIGCDVTIVNSARLPVDPEQVGRIEGTNYVDPRDTLNPVMFKGCHGESLGKVLDSMYGGLASDIFKDPSLDKEQFRAALENFYYTALGDDSWRKSPIQKTLNIRGLHPLVYGLATQHQIAPTNQLNAGEYSMNNPISVSTSSGDQNMETGLTGVTGSSWKAFAVSPTAVYDPTTGEYQTLQQIQTMFTNKTQRLGWMDTLQFAGNLDQTTNGYASAQVAQLPKIFMGLLMLPPAYLCRQYLRVIIRHKFSFSKYRTITTGGGNSADLDFGSSDTAWGYLNRITGNVAPESSSKNLILSGPAAVSDGGLEEVEPDESE